MYSRLSGIWESKKCKGDIHDAQHAAVPHAGRHECRPYTFSTSTSPLSLHDHGQVHSWMDCAVNVNCASRVERPDLDGIAVHLHVLNGRSTRFCCRMRCGVLPYAVA